MTISLPPALLEQFEAIRQSESRIRSELVREALREYAERHFPIVKPTKAEIKAIREGMAAFRRGDYITLEQFRKELAADRHKASKKKHSKDLRRR